MKLFVTVRYIMDAGLWERICDVNGINPWALNEGLCDYNTEIEISLGKLEHWEVEKLLAVSDTHEPEQDNPWPWN